MCAECPLPRRLFDTWVLLRRLHKSTRCSNVQVRAGDGTTGKIGQFETLCYYSVLVYASPRSSWMWALQPFFRCDAPGFSDHFIRWQLKAADTASILLLSSSHPMDEPTSTQILQVSGRHALLIRLVLAVVMHWDFVKCLQMHKAQHCICSRL